MDFDYKEKAFGGLEDWPDREERNKLKLTEESVLCNWKNGGTVCNKEKMDLF